MGPGKCLKDNDCLPNVCREHVKGPQDLYQAELNNQIEVDVNITNSLRHSLFINHMIAN